MGAATEELMQEHRIIERMLAILNAAARRAEAGQPLPGDFFPRAVDFLRNFADRNHHAKEEDRLYPAMERRGIPRQGGPIGVMLMEHDQGRSHVKGMDEAGQVLAGGDASAARKGTRHARAFADLLGQHIQKEDNILYAMADQALSSEDQRQLVLQFAEAEKERMGAEKRKGYLKLLDNLEAELAVK